MNKLWLVLLAGMLCMGASCPLRALRPGAIHSQISATNQTAEVSQPENPLTPAEQLQDWNEEESYTVPAGSTIVTSAAPVPTGTNATVRASAPPQTQQIVLSEPMPVKRVIQRRSEARTGAAQKDTARELTARFAAVRPVQYFAFVLILIGIASLTPWVRPFVGSTTFSFGAIGLGFALIFLAQAVVGHEVLVMGAATAALLVYLFAHKHGTLQGIVNKIEAEAKSIGLGK